MDYKNSIEIKNVTKSFKDFTLNDVSLTLPKGYIMGLVGENGAGKTTLINLIMDTVKKESGQVFVMGTDNKSPQFAPLKNDIGVVLDEASFPFIITAKIVNKMMADIYSNWDEAMFQQYMTRFSLPWDKQFKDFSKGMKMKLAIAVAMSHDPKLLILDEPTSGLDPIVRDEILEVFYDFTRDEEHTILISSHIISDLEKLCDYIAFIHKGHLIFAEEKDQLCEKYAILKCTEAQSEAIPADAVVGEKKGAYNREFLVKRGMVSQAFELEKPSLEDIILYIVKGDRG